MCLGDVSAFTDKLTCVSGVSAFTDKLACVSGVSAFTDKLTCVSDVSAFTDKLACCKIDTVTSHSILTPGQPVKIDIVTKSQYTDTRPTSQDRHCHQVTVY